MFYYTNNYTAKHAQKTISVQIKPINEEKEHFYLHQDVKHLANDSKYKTIDEDFCVLNFLKDSGYTVQEQKQPNKKLYTLYIDFFGFFLIADLLKLFTKDWQKQIMNKITTKKPSAGIIAHARHLKCKTKIQKKYLIYIYLYSRLFQIAIGTNDNCALQIVII